MWALWLPHIHAAVYAAQRGKFMLLEVLVCGPDAPIAGSLGGVNQYIRDRRGEE